MYNLALGVRTEKVDYGNISCEKIIDHHCFVPAVYSLTFSAFVHLQKALPVYEMLFPIGLGKNVCIVCLENRRYCVKILLTRLSVAPTLCINVLMYVSALY